MPFNVKHFCLFALLLISIFACQTESSLNDIQAYQVTFRVVPKSLPDSATVHITGNNTRLGNFDHPYVPMLKESNGKWRRTFRFPRDLRVECTFNLGSPLNEAVDNMGQPLDTLFFTVKQDTEIVVEVANWRDAILSPEEKSKPEYLAEKYYQKARLFRYYNVKRELSDSTRYYFEKAMDLFQQQGNWERLAHCYHVMRGLYPINEQVQYLNKALAISLSHLGKIHPETAEVYARLGEYYKSFGDFKRAMKYIEHALAIYLELYVETHPHVFGCYNEMADIYERMEVYDKAIENYQKALAIEIKIIGPTHQETGNVYKSFGILYAKMGDFKRSIEYFERAMKIHAFYNDEISVTTHMNYYHLGNIYMQAGEYKRAEAYFQKSLAVRKQMYYPYHGHVALGYMALAEAMFAQKAYKKALAHQQQVLQFLLPGFENPDVHSNPAIDNISRYDYRLLRAFIQKGRILYEMVRAQEDLASGQSQDAIQKLQTALDCHDKALQQARLGLGGFLSTNAKLALQGQLIAVVEQAMQTALLLSEITGDNTYKEHAWRFSERGKSALLRLAVQESQAKKFAGIDNAILEQEQALRDEVVKYETLISKAYQTKGRDANEITSLESQYYPLKSQHESLLSDLAKKYPRYFELKHSLPTTTINEVKGMLDENTALLEYFVGENKMYIFVIARDAFEIVVLPKKQHFTQQVMDHAVSIRQVVKSKAYLKSNVQLYNLLIRPVEPFIAAKNNLIIIPDGMLYCVPFEALVSSDRKTSADNYFSNPDYLIKHYEISYHYSASLLLRAANEPKPASAKGQLLAVAPVFRQQNKNGLISPGNSDIFGDLDEQQKRAFVTRNSMYFRELRYSESEARAIVNLFAGNGSIGYFHRQATEERFKAEAGNYRYVHISTHGFMNENNPNLSGLVFSQPLDSTAAEDGILYAAETYTLDLNADLVVLSSCESGIGKIAAGEGVMSMTRGFLYAGAKNVVVSLWKVFDKQTSELMFEFYKSVAAGESFASALRSAKLKMLADPETAHPASWASFVLVGR